MPKAIDPLTQQSIFKDWESGQYSKTELAGAYGIARTTLDRILGNKKAHRDLAETMGAFGTKTESNQSFGTSDDSITPPKLSMDERRRLKTVGVDPRNLYQDRQEHWIFSVTEKEAKIQRSGLWWCFIVYPDSAPPDWEEQITKLGLEWGHSPLHDKDPWSHDSEEYDGYKDGRPYHYTKGELYKKGDKKKPHWHCIIKFEKKIYMLEARDVICTLTHGTIPFKCYSLRKYTEYFIHKNDLDKYQYDADECKFFNGFTIEPNAKEQQLMCIEIAKTIREKQICFVADLDKFYEEAPEYHGLIVARPNYFTTLVKENRWLNIYHKDTKLINSKTGEVIKEWPEKNTNERKK